MESYSSTSWKLKINAIKKNANDSSKGQPNYTVANIDAIQCAIEGYGPDASRQDSSSALAGARMVVNIAAVHVPAFCAESKNGAAKPYKNYYDLDSSRIGSMLANDAQSKKREIVDAALPLDAPAIPNNIYFGAIELNGCGIRFYGDVCLVLKPETVANDTVVLDRNSYDLIRSPIRDIVDSHSPADQSTTRSKEAWKLRGMWSQDLGAMAAIKVIDSLGQRTRRFTTGQISEALRNDEDYLEVLKNGSFSTEDLQEARFFATDAAHDAMTGDRLRQSPTPSLEALMSRKRRHEAEQALRTEGVVVRIATSSGRTKD